MPVRAYLDPNHYFPPSSVKAMGEAFETVCALMAIDEDDLKRREMVARLIITLARADDQADASGLRVRAIKLLSRIDRT
jgi:hypothetical protein